MAADKTVVVASVIAVLAVAVVLWKMNPAEALGWG
jgi:hypothetical protein